VPGGRQPPGPVANLARLNELDLVALADGARHRSCQNVSTLIQAAKAPTPGNPALSGPASGRLDVEPVALRFESRGTPVGNLFPSVGLSIEKIVAKDGL
jgi:hypothetical protein